MIKKFALALRTFFKVIFDDRYAEGVKALAEAPSPEAKEAKVESAGPVRSEAVTLLSALQREARLVDFLMEPIKGYSDAQIGAAVRDVHKGAAAVLERCFDPQPLREEAEGSSLQVAEGFEPFEFHLTGNVAGSPPYSGHLRHHGWKATRCDLPAWSGPGHAALIIAPADVEVS